MDAEYIRYELNKARSADVIRIKAMSDEGESKWLSISPEAYERVISALVGEEK